MDNSAKLFLLAEIIEGARNFKINARRTRMTDADIHNSIHALGYRPLYSGCGINGDEVVSTLSESTAAVIPRTTAGGQVTPQVTLQMNWTPSVLSEDNFRPRKKNAAVMTQPSLQLSEKTKLYVKTIIDGISNSPSRIPTIEPQNESDIITASWFLGLYFSDSVSAPTKDHCLDWMFVRNSLWYFDLAIHAASCEFPSYLSDPWMIGLGTIVANPAIIRSESPAQANVIVKVCNQYIHQYSSAR